ncbi:MAG TPA: hypothetical protein VFX96_15760 [Pyrinomonadaceae bacterium]|nr:hypothetical protein [Pyrinomonadaceae bacterium]
MTRRNALKILRAVVGNTRTAAEIFSALAVTIFVTTLPVEARAPRQEQPPRQEQTTDAQVVRGVANVTPKPEDVRRDEATQTKRAGIRIRVKDSDGQPVARKRFYLLERDVFAAGVDWSSRPRREQFLTGASAELREWLARHDCDSLYCPEYEAEFDAARESVPEFRRAYAEGLRKYKNPRTALRWITVSFPLKNLRTGFYERKRAWTEEAARRAGLVASVMTDERGDAYFLGVEQKDFYVSNVFPLERGRVVWSALVRVPALLPGKLHSASVELLAPKQ